MRLDRNQLRRAVPARELLIVDRARSAALGGRGRQRRELAERVHPGGAQQLLALAAQRVLDDRAEEAELGREQQVIQALREGRSTVPAIVESIYHGLDPALRPAAGGSVRAHLEKLKAEGAASEELQRWRL